MGGKETKTSTEVSLSVSEILPIGEVVFFDSKSCRQTLSHVTGKFLRGRLYIPKRSKSP